MLLEMLQLPIPIGYESQAWLLSSVASGLMGVKIVMWGKSLFSNGKNNGSKMLLSESEGEFRGTIKTLVANQLDLLREMHEAQQEDRKLWAPALREIINSQRSIATLLDKHSKMLIEHDKSEKEVWTKMVGAIEGFQTETRAARAACFEQIEQLGAKVEKVS